MKFLSLVRIVISLMPILIEAIRAVEEALPGSNNGAAKLAMVRGLLESSYETATDTEATFSEIWPAIQKTVSSIVTAFNNAGVFKK